MSRLLLHRAIASPPARAVMMLALRLEYNDVNLLRLEHKTPEFKKLNPMGTVPVLQDDNFVVSESHAIMKYLLEQYGSAESRERLYPREACARALVDQAMFFDAGVFFAALRDVGTSTLFGGIEGPTDAHRANIDSSYGVVEAYLANRRHISADRLTLADLSAGSTATAMQAIHTVDTDRFPRSAEWIARLEQERVFKTVNAPGVAFFTKLLNVFWEKNKNRNKK